MASQTGAPKKGNAMAGQDSGDTSGSGHPGQRSGGPPPGPDAMFSVWTSWIEVMSESASRNWASHTTPWWQMVTNQLAGGTPASGAQLSDTLANDPFLRSVDQM